MHGRPRFFVGFQRRRAPIINVARARCFARMSSRVDQRVPTKETCWSTSFSPIFRSNSLKFAHGCCKFVHLSRRTSQPACLQGPITYGREAMLRRQKRRPCYRPPDRSTPRFNTVPGSAQPSLPSLFQPLLLLVPATLHSAVPPPKPCMLTYGVSSRQL